MSKSTIDLPRAMEILDSRGNPTIRVCCRLSDGGAVFASPFGSACER